MSHTTFDPASIVGNGIVDRCPDPFDIAQDLVEEQEYYHNPYRDEDEDSLYCESDDECGESEDISKFKADIWKASQPLTQGTVDGYKRYLGPSSLCFHRPADVQHRLMAKFTSWLEIQGILQPGQDAFGPPSETTPYYIIAWIAEA